MRTRLLTGNFVKWLESTDSEKAPYMAERIIKHVELYRLLTQRATWIDTLDIVNALNCSDRHARRLLEGFKAAGYIELKRGEGAVRTRARIKRVS